MHVLTFVFSWIPLILVSLVFNASPKQYLVSSEDIITTESHGSFASVGLASLVLLNLNRCGIYDEGCENFEGKCSADC